MSSNINPNNIDGAYPVAGQDNNSQGFRDNFTNTKTNFQYAADEISDLQSKAVLKSALTGTTLNNDMNGSILSNATVQDIAQTRVALGTLSGSVTINYASGSYQTVTTSGSISLAFSNFPSAGFAGTVIVRVTVSSTAHTMTLPSAVGSGSSAASVLGIQGIVSNVITFAETGTYEFQFDTDDNGSTIYLSELTRPRNRYTNAVTVVANTVSTSTTTGALIVGGGAGIDGNLNVGGSGIIAGDLTVTGNLIATGNIAGDKIFNGTTSIEIQTANGNANISIGGVSNVALFTTTGAVITGTLSVTGNVSGANLTTLGDVSGTNITGTLTTPTQPNITSVGTLTSLGVTGNITGGNVSGTNITGTLTTPTQPNITSVGTLTSLGVTGNITGGNVSGTSIVGTLTTPTQPNITSVGTLTSLGVTGNITGGNVSTAGGVSTGTIVIASGAEDLADGAAASLTLNASYFTTAAAETATLAAGTEGQVKVFAMYAAAGNMVITVTNPAWGGAGTITFSAVGQACTLQYINSKWFAIGNNGATFA